MLHWEKGRKTRKKPAGQFPGVDLSLFGKVRSPGDALDGQMKFSSAGTAPFPRAAAADPVGPWSATEEPEAEAFAPWDPKLAGIHGGSTGARLGHKLLQSGHTPEQGAWRVFEVPWDTLFDASPCDGDTMFVDLVSLSQGDGPGPDDTGDPMETGAAGPRGCGALPILRRRSRSHVVGGGSMPTAPICPEQIMVMTRS